MPSSLQVLRNRLAANAKWANTDPLEGTEAARKAGPGRIEYWLARQPESLPESERLRRAECAKRAFYLSIQLKSAKARAQKKAS